MAGNPILMLLEGNGSLIGRDRSGAFTATGSGALRYAKAEGARQNFVQNPNVKENANGWNTATRVADSDFSSGWCLEIEEDTIHAGFDGGGGFLIRDGDTFTVSFTIKWMSGEQADWYVGAVHPGFGTKTFYNVVPGDLDGAPHRIVVTSDDNPQIGSIMQNYMIVSRGQLAPSGTSTIRIGDFIFEEGITDGSWFEPEVWFHPYTGQLVSQYASGGCERAVFWIEEGTTNLIAEPSFNINNWWDGWGPLGPPVNDGQRGWLQGCAYKTDVTTNNHGHAPSVANSPAVAAGETITFAVDVYSPDGDVSLSGNWLTGAGADNGFISAVTDGSVDGWVHLVLTATAPANTAKLRPLIISADNATYTFWWCHAQLEKKAYATSRCFAQAGNGYAATGTVGSSASTRTGGLVTVPDDLLDSTAGTGALKFNSTEFHIDTQGKPFVAGSWGGDPGDTIDLSFADAGFLQLWATTDGSVDASVETLGSVSPNVWNFAAALWSEAIIGIWANGVLNTEPRATPPNGAWYVGTNTVRIGGLTGDSQNINGLVGPVVFYDRVLTDAELDKIDRMIDAWAPLWNAVGRDSMLALAMLTEGDR